MVTGELTRKEFIMAKLSGVKFNQVVGNKGNDLKAKVARNIVAIANEKGLCVVTNNADYTAWYQCDSIVDASLEGLVDLLESIPDNTDLLDKPYRVVLPRAISGIATGSFIDYIRTGKSVTSGEVMPKARLEMFAKVMKLMATKYANVELVADRHASKADSEVRDAAWKAVKAEVTNRVHGTSAIQSAPVVSGPSEEDLAKIKQLRAEIDALEDELEDTDDEEMEAKIQKKIDKKVSRIARIKAMSGQKEEDKAEEPQVADDIKDLFN